ncbi:unnamed protein product, partial [Ilex paraguariensis]
YDGIYGYRTMQTAVGVFGGDGYTDRMDIGVHPCDKREASVNINAFSPQLTFRWQIESDEDILWKANVRETKEELAARGMKFMNWVSDATFRRTGAKLAVCWLCTREEKEIAIVTHSGFLFHTLGAFGNDCHPLVKKKFANRLEDFAIMCSFANCELRSMVIVDRSMIGSDSSTTNYPGKIPSGPDLPSSVVDEKNLGKDEPNSGLH